MGDMPAHAYRRIPTTTVSTDDSVNQGPFEQGESSEMSEHHEEDAAVSGRAVMGGLVGAAVVGAMAGVIVSAASWSRPVSIESNVAVFAYMVVAGLVVGGGTGLAMGLILSWHGAKTGADPTSPAAAPLWGGFTALVLGLVLGPFFGFALGIFFSHFADGALLGLACGPLLAILAWQAGFWLARMGGRS